MYMYLGWLNVVAFGDFGVELFDVGETTNETGRTAVSELAMKNKFRFAV